MLRVLPEFNVWAGIPISRRNLLSMRERTGNFRFVQHPSKDHREAAIKSLKTCESLPPIVRNPCLTVKSATFLRVNTLLQSGARRTVLGFAPASVFGRSH